MLEVVLETVQRSQEGGTPRAEVQVEDGDSTVSTEDMEVLGAASAHGQGLCTIWELGSSGIWCLAKFINPSKST